MDPRLRGDDGGSRLGLYDFWEQCERQERGQTTVSSGGVWFARVYNGGQGQWLPAFAGMTAVVA